MELRAGVSHVGGTLVLAVEGVADLSTAPSLHRALTRLQAGDGAAVAVDLDGLAVLDDVAVGLLLGAAARIRERGGELVLVCTAPRLLARLESLRVDRIVHVSASISAVDGRTAR